MIDFSSTLTGRAASPSRAATSRSNSWRAGSIRGERLLMCVVVLDVGGGRLGDVGETLKVGGGPVKKRLDLAVKQREQATN